MRSWIIRLSESFGVIETCVVADMQHCSDHPARFIIAMVITDAAYSPLITAKTEMSRGSDEESDTRTDHQSSSSLRESESVERAKQNLRDTRECP